METKNEGMLTSLARTVGTTAGVIVTKTTQLKDEVVKMGNNAIASASKRSPKKAVAKKTVAKKTTAKKASTKKTVSRKPAKKKKTTKRLS